jgi:hypothetical protein
MMQINDIRDTITSAILKSMDYVSFSVIPVSPNRLYVQVLVPGFTRSTLRVKAKRSELIVCGSDLGYETRLYKPTPFTMIFPMCGLTVDSVDLVDGVLRIAMNLEHPDAEKEYSINIPQPKDHPQYLTEDSIF